MRLIVLLACSVLAVACGSGSHDIEPLPEIAVPQGATEFTARPDIVDPHPVQIQGWSRAGDDRIALHFETGTPECYGVHATITETTDAVGVTVLGGTLPEAQDRMCIMIAVTGTLEVPLESPLGDRVVTAGEPH
ncbi:hypothetical protein [Rhodococcus sp. 105337]|uniref:hypothetical protein n=1 Tax=Rhodococcus sp. 105337 TaxID=2725310 RepID=UPI00146AE72A|nr:hypothetical protein [Rhodococcus sp. 105337]NME80119.1 hypothetical protein [Rhodococcus sp. 105337]